MIGLSCQSAYLRATVPEIILSEAHCQANRGINALSQSNFISHLSFFSFGFSRTFFVCFFGEGTLIFKAQKRYAFESHLQAYIVQNFDSDPLHSFINADEIHSPIWIGNEVSCGVGMQRIDILTMQEDDAKIHINIIELKDEKPYAEIITNQLPWYIDWVVEYLCPLYQNKEITIAPIVIASTFQRQRDIDVFENCCAEFEYETANHITVNPIEYIGFEIDENISFEKVF